MMSSVFSIRFVTTALSCAAFRFVITGFPVCFSTADLASFAAVPPRFAIAWLSSKEPGFSFLEISVEVDSDRKNPLMNPFVAVTLFLISLQCAVNGKFRINGFFYALSADLCKPQLKRFRFWGWNRLDNAKKLLGVGNIGLVTLTVCREHFQLTTFCRQLASIFFQARFQDAPIFGGKRVSG